MCTHMHNFLFGSKNLKSKLISIFVQEEILNNHLLLIICSGAKYNESVCSSYLLYIPTGKFKSHLNSSITASKLLLTEIIYKLKTNRLLQGMTNVEIHWTERILNISLQRRAKEEKKCLQFKIKQVEFLHHEEVWNVTCHNPFRQPVKKKKKKVIVSLVSFYTRICEYSNTTQIEINIYVYFS